MRFIDSIPVKFILLFLCWLLVTAIAFLVFFLYHLPQPRRLVANTWRFMASIAVVSSGASALGLPRLVGVTVDPQIPSTKFVIDWGSAATSVTATVTVSLVLLLVAAWLYVYLIQWEMKHGQLTV